MMQRMWAMGAVLFAALLMAAPAGAQSADDDEYVPPPTVAEENEDGTVTVTGECPGEESIRYEVRRGASGRGPILEEGTVETEDDGSFEFTTGVLPNGRHTITIYCGDNVEVLTVNINRGQGAGAGTGQQGSGALARTGTDSSLPLARLGMILVATGGVALYAAKKRNGRRAAFIAG